MADIGPKTGMLESMRKQSLQWHIILGELIDNAFDAGAKRVSVSFDSKKLEVIDDGKGCSDVLKMVTIGDREDHKTTRLGRYGIGAKDASISAADAISITSCCNGVERFLSVNWRDLEKTGDWVISDPTETPVDSPSGTRIVMMPIRTERVKNIDSLIRMLSITYTPAIRSGRQIIFKSSRKSSPIAIAEFKTPPLENQVTCNFDINGKDVHVTMGLVPQGHTIERSGLMVSYDFRVIMQGQRIGLGDKPTPGLFGWVELGKGWELTKNKDNISGSLADLDEAIYSHCRSTIEAASKRHETIRFSEVEDGINRLLDEFAAAGMPPNRKAKRAPRTHATGAILPMASERRHKRAAVTQPGATFTDATGRKKGLKVSFQSMGASGKASVFQDGIVYLNSDIPAIASAATDKKAIATHAVYAAATWLAMHNHQLSLFEGCENIFDRMAQAAGNLLGGLNLSELSREANAS
jgi:hypothetical protein